MADNVTVISKDVAKAHVFHSFDVRSTLLSSLMEDPCPEHDPFAVNHLTSFEPPVLIENLQSIHDRHIQQCLAIPAETSIHQFIEQNCHVKYTPLYIIERYIEGNIPGTLDTFGQPYLPAADIDLSSYQAPPDENSNRCEFKDVFVPFYLSPSFFMQHITPPHFDPVYDIALRPHYVELMHFRDRFPYVESSFLYLQNVLCRQSNYLFAYRYYGSFQGIQQTYKHAMDADELVDIVQNSPYFLKNLRKLFFMDKLDIDDFYNECSNRPIHHHHYPPNRRQPTDKLTFYPLYVKNFPVHIQLMDKLPGKNLYSVILTCCDASPNPQWSEQTLISLFAQIALQLRFYQELFEFRHNDLHGQNVLVSNNDHHPSSVQYIKYEFESSSIVLPMYGNAIARIIDFGRVKFTFNATNYFSDEMAPWGAVGDHCNVRSSSYFQREHNSRPIPATFDFAYLCCMIAKYISTIGGPEKYRRFLERYPILFEFMYECTKQSNSNNSFLDSGMRFIRSVVWPTMSTGSEQEEDVQQQQQPPLKKKKRNIPNHHLIEPAPITFDSDFILNVVDFIHPSIDYIDLLTNHPRISRVLYANNSSVSVPDHNIFSVRDMKALLETHLVSTVQNAAEHKKREEMLELHDQSQGQVLHQIRKRFHGKIQNPFWICDDERDYNDYQDTFSST